MRNRADGSNSNANDERSLGLNGINKAHQGRKRFFGGFDQALRQFLEFNDSMARVCELTDQQKVKAMPVMLDEEALYVH